MGYYGAVSESFSERTHLLFHLVIVGVPMVRLQVGLRMLLSSLSNFIPELVMFKIETAQHGIC